MMNKPNIFNTDSTTVEAIEVPVFERRNTF